MHRVKVKIEGEREMNNPKLTRAHVEERLRAMIKKIENEAHHEDHGAFEYLAHLDDALHAVVSNADDWVLQALDHIQFVPVEEKEK